MHKWNGNRKKEADSLVETTTKSTPKPGEYPVGSLESRAAARALVENREKSALEIQIVYVSPDGKEVNGPKYKIQR
jgi:hypothetical protein